MQTIPESRILKALEKLFRTKASSVEELLEDVDFNSPLRFPFRLTDLRVLNVNLNVAGWFVNPRARSPIVEFFLETPDSTLLIYDGHGVKSELYFVQMSCDSEIALRWLRMMTFPMIHVTTFRGDVVVAAPVSGFTT